MAALTSVASNIVSVSYLTGAGLAALGFAVAQPVTKSIRSNVAAIDFRGSEAAYPLVGAILTQWAGRTVGLSRFTRPVSFGMVAAATLAAKREVLS